MLEAISESTTENSKMDLATVLGLPEPLMVSGANLDSRAVVKGDAFVALQGETTHGLSFAALAKKSGAVVILMDAADNMARDQALLANQDLPIVLVGALRSKLGGIARALYGEVDRELALVGVTGTDGKTSITHFVAQLLGLNGGKCAVLGTVGNGFLSGLHAASHTTSDVFQVYSDLAQLRRAGARTVAMEVSSHALHQNRVAGLNYEVAVLSNLGSDHLDYHGDLASYARAKAMLFDRRAKTCVLNLDDSFGLELVSQHPDCTTYSARAEANADWTATECKYSTDGIECKFSALGMQRRVLLPVLGGFNVSNILAACAVAHRLGESVESILDRLPKLQPVVGRAELLLSSKGSRVVIDYAHTAQALAAILGTLRDHFSARIWCVFGCGGDRDRSKRPAMAKAAREGADCLVVTSDNPRSEQPLSIIDDILAGLSSRDDVHTEVDRASAIAYALQHASNDDCVLIAGKGHEDYQVLADRTIEFSDRAEVLAWQADLT